MKRVKILSRTGEHGMYRTYDPEAARKELEEDITKFLQDYPTAQISFSTAVCSSFTAYTALAIYEDAEKVAAHNSYGWRGPSS